MAGRPQKPISRRLKKKFKKIAFTNPPIIPSLTNPQQGFLLSKIKIALERLTTKLIILQVPTYTPRTYTYIVIMFLPTHHEQ